MERLEEAPCCHEEGHNHEDSLAGIQYLQEGRHEAGNAHGDGVQPLHEAENSAREAPPQHVGVVDAQVVGHNSDGRNDGCSGDLWDRAATA